MSNLCSMVEASTVVWGAGASVVVAAGVVATGVLVVAGGGVVVPTEVG